ncbi:hypothetical protein KTS45_14980 [Halomicroarcula limicola]|uniref:Uncharacterized protein n=1 Tax=Haloarcula limicola TaxID=1429915 RepID=A0A8J7YFG3_9EURY|nr:hypothetical protein [Halomicroarcula limicola]MBV0925508.1 hypothetical protein [Halomicroarcula limicola]
MTTDAFTDPDDGSEWVDVRMTDPDAGEWDIDVVVADGRVEYVDLRIRPSLLSGFIDCLVEDVAEERAHEVLRETAARNGIDLDDLAEE